MEAQDKDILVDLVKKEAAKLRLNATPDEIAKLDFDKLNPDYSDACIYGQMTGVCWSERAHNLINQCAERLYVQSVNSLSLDECTLNGEPNLAKPTLFSSNRYGNFSPI